MSGEVETIKIGGVEFLQKEVKKVDKITDGSTTFFTVQTTSGTFSYNEQGFNGSIMNNKVKNMILDTYTGTKGKDVLYLENSSLHTSNLNGDHGNGDIIYFDSKSHYCEEADQLLDKGDFYIKNDKIIKYGYDY